MSDIEAPGAGYWERDMSHMSGAVTQYLGAVIHRMFAGMGQGMRRYGLVQQGKMAAFGSLFAGIAHELNTPLGSLASGARVVETAAARLVAGDALHAERLLDMVAGTAVAMRAATDRMVSVLQALRAFARTDEAEEKAVDLHEGIDATIALMRHRFAERIRVERRYGELPLHVCRPRELNQVFLHLLSNAVEVISGEGTATVTTSANDSEILVQIADNGCGISAADMPRIFDPGFTTRGVGVGLGLGLATSYRIVTAHGGHIDVESSPGAGSTVTVRLPRATPNR